MSVLALVTKSEEIHLVVSWAAAFAKARGTTFKVVCWTYSSLDYPDSGLPSDGSLADEVRSEIQAAEVPGALHQLSHDQPIEICSVASRASSVAVTEMARSGDIELIVAASEDPSGETGGTYATSDLLRESPCNTVVLFGGANRSVKTDRVFVAVTDSPHDMAALFIANRMIESSNCRVTLARSEMDFENEAFEVGNRELQQMIRDAGVKKVEQIECRVFRSGDYWGMTTALDENDLILMGANNPNIHLVLELTNSPTIAVVKRAPPIRRWGGSRRSSEWASRLSPADYADLITGLRRGSRLNADFLTMLCLASVVASMGLLQDSPAVVIGAGMTFRLLGVTASRVGSRQQSWVIRTVTILGCVGVLFFIPLHLALMKSLGEAKPQPRNYPLTWEVTEALEEYIADTPDIQLISAGRPSSPHEPSDVVLVLGAPRDLDRDFASRLIEIIREKMDDDSLIVEVHCIRELWLEMGD